MPNQIFVQLDRAFIRQQQGLVHSSWMNTCVFSLSLSRSLAVLTQCDQIEQFWQVLAINFLTKAAETFGKFLGYFENITFLSKNCCGRL